MYRDSRINRIFEGTNEINRMLAVGQVLKKAMKGELDLMGPAKKIQDELMEIPDFDEESDGSEFYWEHRAIGQAKKAILMTAGAAAQKFMLELEKQQEILMNLADMAIEVFAAESTILRTEKRIELLGIGENDLQIKMCRCYLSDSLERVYISGKHAISGFTGGDEQRMMLIGLKRFTKADPLNTIAIRKEIASAMIASNDYCF
jgi:hypothetical protein